METTLIRLKLDFTDKIYVFSDEIKPQITPYVKYDKIDFKEIFGNENPVNVEIGIGNGEFIAHYAALNKNENFIGFEVYKKIIRKAIKRCDHQCAAAAGPGIGWPRRGR